MSIRPSKNQVDSSKMSPLELMLIVPGYFSF